jgi:hypothetical protein
MIEKTLSLRQSKSFYLAFILGTIGGFLSVIGLSLTFAAKSASTTTDSKQTIIRNSSSTLNESSQKVIHREYPPASLTYNVTQPPPFASNVKLQQVIDSTVSLVKAKNLPLNALSISLVSLNSDRCCEYAGYQDQQPRFPASVSKLFWLVPFFAQVEKGVISETSVPPETLYKMIQKSDNESASIILDKTTGTTSGDDLDSEQLGIWSAKRKWVNYYYESAGYHSPNLSQKNFPVPYLKLQEPQGRDLQLRGNRAIPMRNSLSTHDASRLMFEIHTRQAVSREASQKMEQLLHRDLQPGSWKKEQYNSVEGFLGESLPQSTYLASKVGWTSQSRQEVALISSPDGKARYILTVFGDDRTFADDWEIFPQLSKHVYNQMLIHH